MSGLSPIVWNMVLPLMYVWIIIWEGREASKSVPTPRDRGRLGFSVAFVLLGALDSISDLHEHRWLWVLEIIAVALVAYNVWREFRRRRKPKPVKARGRVVNLGHRLAVEAE